MFLFHYVSRPTADILSTYDIVFLSHVMIIQRFLFENVFIMGNDICLRALSFLYLRCILCSTLCGLETFTNTRKARVSGHDETEKHCHGLSFPIHYIYTQFCYL